MISICCVGFASLDVVCNVFNDCVSDLVCSSFLISVCCLLCRIDMGLYAMPLSMSLVGFGIGTRLVNFHMYVIMLVLRAVFNILMRNVSPRGPMCFCCLMFSLSGPSELLFLVCSGCNVISLYFMCCSVNGSVCLVCYVFDSVC